MPVPLLHRLPDPHFHQQSDLLPDPLLDPLLVTLLLPQLDPQSDSLLPLQQRPLLQPLPHQLFHPLLLPPYSLRGPRLDCGRIASSIPTVENESCPALMKTRSEDAHSP